MKILKNKQGVIDQLAPIITGLVGVAIVLVVGFLIMAQVGEQSSLE